MSQRIIFLVLIFSWFLFCSVHSYSIQSENKRIEAMSNSVNAQILIPVVENNESIKLAMLSYSIKAPKGCTNPQFDPELKDRGITIKRPWNDEYIVEIGPKAFDSWAILGATLAHEVEVHCNQNFVWVNFLDFIGMDGTGFAERVAYNYEITNQDRFGLTSEDILSISITKEKHYPYPSETKQPERLYSYFENIVTELLRLRI